MKYRYKIIGNKEYAYSYDYYIDKKTKQRRQRSKYLGQVINKKNKIFIKVRKEREKKEKLILDYGDSFVLDELLKRFGFSKIIENIFEEKSNFVKGLIYYRLCQGGAMRLAMNWIDGNYAKIILKKTNLTSQRISEGLEKIGDENYIRQYFKSYIAKLTNPKDGLVIDATSLPNQINIPITAWGRKGEEIDKQIRFLLVVDKKNDLPLFYKYYSGNIVDVSTLKETFKELGQYGINETFVYLDAGYYSKDNIINLYDNKISFLTRLPCVTKQYKELVQKYQNKVETPKNVIKYGKRALFVKRIKIDLHGNEGYSYIVIDPERKGRETKNLAIKIAGEEDLKDIDYALKTRGLMILISSSKLTTQEVVPAFYVRQSAEKMFGFSKDDLGILPLNVHKEETLSGFLLIQFITLCFFMRIKKLLGKEYSVEEALLILRNLKCKVFENKILVCEKTKQQKEVLKQLMIDA